uniref:Uncharacterized AAA domain-containing protein ycf46 n=1 Tax=Stylophora pistillata TaxID=50429 RepID=A0A2B4S1S9_STYPI
MAFYNQLKTHIQAKVPCIYIETTERLRLQAELKNCCKEENLEIQFWNEFDGIDGEHKEDFKRVLEDLNSKDELKYDVTVFESADLLDQPDNINVVRSLAILLYKMREKKHQIIIVASSWNIPNFIQNEIAVLDFPLPNKEDIKTLLQEAEQNFKIDVDNSNTILETVRGLGTTAIRNAFAKVAIESQKITTEEIEQLVAEKEQIIRKSGYLEFIKTQQEMSAIGGLEKLKQWLENRKVAFGSKARENKLSTPKGLLLLGIPGTGKSLCAKVVSKIWQKPLLRLDMGRIFGGLVGESESNMRQAIKVAESLEPCVLWIDEIEKGLSGGTGGERDGGTSTRVFGSLLTWMQEKQKEVFIFATANDVSKLPPELLRKGRFDEIFFVDLPDKKARKEIFKIHLQRKEQSYQPTEEILKKTEGFSGAEIEAIIDEACFLAYNEKKEDNNINAQNLIDALENIVPLSITMKETIENLRKWADKRCRKASDAEPPEIRNDKDTPTLKQEINFISEQYQLRVMNDSFRQLKKMPLWKALSGDRVAKSPKEQEIELENNRLNEEQKKAVVGALNAPELFLIWGPPGTGKTEVIKEIAKQEGKRGNKTLICSQANLAVDNALARLYGEKNIFPYRIARKEYDLEGEDIVKIPFRDSVPRFSVELLEEQLEKSVKNNEEDEDVKKLRSQFLNRLQKVKNRMKKFGSKKNNPSDTEMRESKQFIESYRNKINVVGTTLMEAGKKVEGGKIKIYQETEIKKFDTVIIDEVSKATPPELFIPICLGKKVILVGDFKQLPPMFKILSGDEKTQEEWAKEANIDETELDTDNTIFERLWDRHIGDSAGVKAMLSKQYRMHPHIESIIQPFYTDSEGSLSCGLNEQEIKNLEFKENDFLKPTVWIGTRSGDVGKEKREGTSFINRDEIEKVVFTGVK